MQKIFRLQFATFRFPFTFLDAPFFTSLFSFTLLLLAACKVAQADFFIHTWEDHFTQGGYTHLQSDSMYYASTSNFGPTGNLTTPQGLQGYTRFQQDALLSHGIFDRFSLFGRLSWAYINSNSSQLTGTDYGLADQSVGMNIRILRKKDSQIPSQYPAASFDFQFQTDIPAYNIASSQARSLPDLGDETLDFTAGAFTNFPLWHYSNALLQAAGGAGYTYRTLGYSSAIPWSATLQYLPPGEGFFLTAGGGGIASLSTDTNPNGRSSRGSGGSFITGDINPSLLYLQGRGGYQFSPQTQIAIAVSQSVWGQDTPNGLCFSLRLQTQLGSDKKNQPTHLTPEEYGKSNQGFLTYTLNAQVVKTNDRFNLVKINKGSEDGIEVGQIFDLFLTKKDGTTGETIARGKVMSVRPNEAALNIIEFYKEVSIEEGFTAKRLVQ